MAKPTDPDSTIPKRKGASIFVWLLLTFVILGLGGFGVHNFGGGVASLGKVGDREISLNDYARALQQEIRAFGAQVGKPVTLAEAQTLGLDRQVLQQLVTRTALDNEAERVGISVGDAAVAAQVTGMDAFHGPAGSFDRETYRFALQRNNLTEVEFERGLRDDLSRSLLQGAVVGGFVAPQVLTDTLYSYIAERRGFSVLKLTEADLAAPLAEATEPELIAFHTAQIAQFTRPEARRITYVSLLPDDLAAEMKVDEATLKARYDERIDDFVKPERRLVERLVFGTEDEAKAAKARLDNGEVTFEALVTERGLTLADIDLGDVGQKDLGAAGDAVFALTEPGITGPYASDLGPALFRMNGILAAQNTTFEHARAELEPELALDAARRAISDRLESINDDLAGGATLEEVAETQKMKIATFDYIPGGTNDEAIAGYPDFRTAAEAAEVDSFPEAILLDDGGMMALRLDEILPPAPIPFADVKDKVAEAWRAQALDKALADQAVAAKAAVEAGASLGTQGIVDVTTSIARNGFVEGAPTALLTAVFQMAVGDLRVIEEAGYVALVRLDTIIPAPAAGEEAEAQKGSIATQVEQAIAQDAFTAFSNALTSEAGVTLDQAAINGVHAQFN